MAKDEQLTKAIKSVKTIERFRKEGELNVALDYLCRATGRDIFVMLPENVEERNPYLIEEIKKTVELL